MDLKSEVGIFLEYSINRKAYMIYNTHTKTVMKSINVVNDNLDDKQVVKDEGDVSPQQTDIPSDVLDKGFDIKTDIETENTDSEETTINKGPSI